MSSVSARLVLEMKTNYRLVYDEIMQRIRTGTLREHDQLPSITALAEELDVGKSSVKVALIMLRDHDVIRGHQGLGTFVTLTGVALAELTGESSAA